MLPPRFAPATVIVSVLCLIQPSCVSPVSSQRPTLAGVGEAMESMAARQEVSGAVTMVVSRDKVLHLQATGNADIATGRPMTPDTVFWIASMSKPVTAAALLMLQDEGLLNVSDPVAKHLPSFAGLRTPSGAPASPTLAQLLTHTSGLGEASGPQAQKARTLADLEPVWAAAPMQFAPGEKWKYCQSGINAAGRVVEVVSGMRFDEFLQKRLFAPLGMKDTTFYPDAGRRARLATAYARNASGSLEAVPPRADYGPGDRPPQGNGGLYSTAEDYSRFCRMLLAGGVFEGKQILSAEAVRFMATPQTGDLATGFFQQSFPKNYGWGLGTCVLKTPHEGVASMLSPGSFGHGGAWGTQAWVDPVKGVAYVLMVQRSNFPNSDGSPVRQAFQEAASRALTR